MFYTLVSRFLITNVNTSRDYLNIFLIGSVGYVALHWYLHMDTREGIVEKIREYLYYAMVVDIITAYLLMTMYPQISDKQKEEHNNIDNNQEEYTPEEKQKILQRMQETRRLQQHKQCNEEQYISPDKKSDNQQHNTELLNTKVKQCEEKQDDNNDNKKSIFTKSDESKESSKTYEDIEPEDTENIKCQSQQSVLNDNIRVKGKKKQEDLNDTEIPIFDNTMKGISESK